MTGPVCLGACPVACLVVGGGPAGSATAIHLARSGATPLLIERLPVPGDALCGGFLSWRTLDLLAQLGISQTMLAGHEVRNLRLVTGDSASTVALPRPGMSLSRRRLDSLLLKRAQDMGAVVRHGSARFEEGRIVLDDGEVLAAESIFLATGKHDLRGLTRPREAAGADPMIGLRWHLSPPEHLASQLRGHIEMHLFDRGYAGIVLREDGSANLCLAVHKSRLAEAEGDPSVLLAQLSDVSSLMAQRCAEISADAPFDAIGHLPYHWRAMTSVPGLFRLGDQAGVIASFAGEGMGIALASAAQAVDFWRKGGARAAPAFQARFAARLARPIRVARALAAVSRTPSGARMLRRLSGIPGLVPSLASITRI